MTVRTPLVKVNGKIIELDAADSISGAPGQGTALNGMNGGAVTIAYFFSTTTTDADPGNGFLRLNNATQNTATQIFADLVDTSSVDWTSVLDTFDASTSTVKGSIRLVKVQDATKYLAFNITVRTTATGYRKFTITNTGSSTASPFTNGDSILLCFDRSGDAGTNGSNGTNGVMSLVSQVITSSSQATVSFASLGSNTHLILKWLGRDTNAASAELGFRMGFNGDTTAGNYTSLQLHQGLNSTTNTAQLLASASAGSVIGSCPGVNGNANAVGAGTVEILNYRNTTFHKPVTVAYGDIYSATPNLDTANGIFVWKSTAAISSILITCGGTAFVDGSIFSLYAL